MKKHMTFAMAFAMAVAGTNVPALAQNSPFSGIDIRNHFLEGMDFSEPPQRIVNPPSFSTRTSCGLRDLTKLDLGSGWSVELGGSLNKPKLKLGFEMSLQPHLERKRCNGIRLSR